MVLKRLRRVADLPRNTPMREVLMAESVLVPSLLSPEGENHFESLRKQLTLISDRAVGVAEKYQTGVYLTGRPGTGKTRTVSDTWTNSSAKRTGFYKTLA
jgi:Cdc6-like AAA superfamily ATPase